MVISDRSKVAIYRVLTAAAVALWLLQVRRLLRGENLDSGPTALPWLVVSGLYLVVVPWTADAREARQGRTATDAEPHALAPFRRDQRPPATASVDRWERVFGRPFSPRALVAALACWLVFTVVAHLWWGWSWSSSLVSCLIGTVVAFAVSGQLTAAL